jgi:hypothetical protein
MNLSSLPAGATVIIGSGTISSILIQQS